VCTCYEHMANVSDVVITFQMQPLQLKITLDYIVMITFYDY